MPEQASTRASYDRIAHLYDVDMARNMPFDDVAFYAVLAGRASGRVLELGCGNGRILLELLGRGVNAYGIERSAPMLAELHRKAGPGILEGRVFRMDARALGFVNAFALVLCPYSFVTYMSEEEDLERMFGGVRKALTARGRIVIDAFVPLPGIAGDTFRIDYQRPYRDATLTRAKRVVPLGAQRNRIERRYALVANDGTTLEQIETSEDIRLFTPEALRGLLTAAEFSIEKEWWDYAPCERPAHPRFFTVSARPQSKCSNRRNRSQR